MKALLLLAAFAVSYQAHAAPAGTGGAMAQPVQPAKPVQPVQPVSDGPTNSPSNPQPVEDKSELAEKFGDNWKSSKKSEDLLLDKALQGENGKNVNLSQEDSYTMVSNTLYTCVEVAANGRTDEICQTTPNHPECVGVAGALANATSCAEYFTPATLGCKTYGTSGYGIDEWVAIGEQFQNQMVSCAKKKEEFDSAEYGAKLRSLTDMIGAQSKGASITAPNLKDAILAPASSVSGDIKKDMSVGSLDWDDLAGKIRDGASYLGYQNGDIIKASMKGEPFSSIVSESPFVQKLNFENRAKVEEGLADSKMIAQRVVQTHQEKTGSEPLAEMAQNFSPTEQSGSVHIGPKDGTSPYASNAEQSATDSGGLAPDSRPASPSTQSTPTYSAAPISQERSRLMLEAERQELVAATAARARSEKKSYRELASMAQSRVENLMDTSLFQRVSQAYRRRSSGMNGLESRSGDLIRSIEKPEIFRDL